MGTSTGGIIAIGLAMETPAKEIARFYETERPRIFPRRCEINKWLGRARDIFQPKFSSSALSVAIKGVVGDRSLKEAKTRLVDPCSAPLRSDYRDGDLLSDPSL
jgi:uncharacterized protein